MAKPTNPGQGNGNGNGNEGEDDAAHVVVVVTEDAEHRYEGTSRMAVASDGALLVGKNPTAIYAATEWLRAYVEPLVPEPIP